MNLTKNTQKTYPGAKVFKNGAQRVLQQKTRWILCLAVSYMIESKKNCTIVICYNHEQGL